MNFKQTNKDDNKYKSPYCVITEQGDLGLGADVLDDKDQKHLEDSNKKQKNINDNKR